MIKVLTSSAKKILQTHNYSAISDNAEKLFFMVEARKNNNSCFSNKIEVIFKNYFINTS